MGWTNGALMIAVIQDVSVQELSPTEQQQMEKKMYYTQRNYVEAIFERNHGNLDHSMAAWQWQSTSLRCFSQIMARFWVLRVAHLMLGSIPCMCAMMLATGTHGRMARFRLLAFWCPAASLVCAMLLATTHGSCEHLLQGYSSLKLKDAVFIFCCWCT